MTALDKAGFFLAGLFNNASFVIMIAGAKVSCHKVYYKVNMTRSDNNF